VCARGCNLGDGATYPTKPVTLIVALRALTPPTSCAATAAGAFEEFDRVCHQSRQTAARLWRADRGRRRRAGRRPDVYTLLFSQHRGPRHHQSGCCSRPRHSIRWRGSSPSRGSRATRNRSVVAMAAGGEPRCMIALSPRSVAVIAQHGFGGTGSLQISAVRLCPGAPPG